MSTLHKKPKWLYGKLQIIHEQFEDVVEDCEAWLAESELSGQSKDGEIWPIEQTLRYNAHPSQGPWDSRFH